LGPSRVAAPAARLGAHQVALDRLHTGLPSTSGRFSRERLPLASPERDLRLVGEVGGAQRLRGELVQAGVLDVDALVGSR
jgi:hypothetical protein